MQGVLSKVNADFVHSNPDLLFAPCSCERERSGVVKWCWGYFKDDVFHEAHVLVFLHLLLVIEQALAARTHSLGMTHSLGIR